MAKSSFRRKLTKLTVCSKPTAITVAFESCHARSMLATGVHNASIAISAFPTNLAGTIIRPKTFAFDTSLTANGLGAGVE